MKQVTFTTELGTFIAVFGKLDSIDEKELPSHTETIGKINEIGSHNLWNKIGQIPMGIAAAILEYNPLILKQS